MCGMRGAGDLVLRVQLAKGLKINEAKKYVAEKLGVSVLDLSDCSVMTELREKLGIGVMQPVDETPNNMEAKFLIADILGLPINSVERFKERAGLKK